MPRGLRTALRIVLLVVGGVTLLIGAAASILIGSDDTAQSGPHDVFTPGVAIVTDAEALHYVGPTLHLTVEREDGDPVFVGVANEVDAASYLGGQSRRVVSRVKLPWTPTATETGAGTEPLPAPGQQPWWIDSVDGARPAGIGLADPARSVLHRRAQRRRQPGGRRPRHARPRAGGRVLRCVRGGRVRTRARAGGPLALDPVPAAIRCRRSRQPDQVADPYERPAPYRPVAYARTG